MKIFSFLLLFLVILVSHAVCSTLATESTPLSTTGSHLSTNDEILLSPSLSGSKNQGDDESNYSAPSSKTETTIQVEETVQKVVDVQETVEKSAENHVVEEPLIVKNVESEKSSHSQPENDNNNNNNLPHDHELMHHSTRQYHNDAAFQADATPKGQKLDKSDKMQAMSDIVSSQKDKRAQERKRHPATSLEFIELHGQRVSIATLRSMCQQLRVDHLPFLNLVASRELELSLLFAANRLTTVFDSHKIEKRIASVEEISCSHGIQIAKSPEADKLYELLSEAIREGEGIRLHLLDLADAWTITQTKDSDLVEEVVASLGYYTVLTRIGNSLAQKLSYLRTPGALTDDCGNKNRNNNNNGNMIVQVANLVKEIPEGVPNWTHMRVGAEMLIEQCSMEPSLSEDL